MYALIGLKKKNIYSFCILFYLLTIFLSSNLIFLIGTAFAERFLYVPLLGATIFAAILLSKIFKIKNIVNAKNSGVFSLVKGNKNVFFVLVLLLIPMTYKTIARNKDWKSDYILFTTDAKNFPLSARSHFSHADNIVSEKIMNSSVESEKSFWLDSALAEYNRAIDIYPLYADAIGQRGVTYFIKGDKPKAFEDYKKSIELNTKMATTYNNIGYLYSETGEHATAIKYYNIAIDLDSRFVEAWRNLGKSYYALKEYDKAIGPFVKALKLAPEDANINYFLGQTYRAIKEDVLAQPYLEKANRLNLSKGH